MSFCSTDKVKFLSFWKYRSVEGQEGNRRASSAVSPLEPERLTVDFMINTTKGSLAPPPPDGNVVSFLLSCPDLSGSSGSVPISAARSLRRPWEEREDVHIGPARPSSPRSTVLTAVSSPEDGCSGSAHLSHLTLTLSVCSSNRDANANVAPSVKMRPKSPNSCLDADVQRRLTDDNGTEPNQPIPVHLRQRASARCECAHASIQTLTCF